MESGSAQKIGRHSSDGSTSKCDHEMLVVPAYRLRTLVDNAGGTAPQAIPCGRCHSMTERLEPLLANAICATLLALVVAIAARFRLRPVVMHALWLIVLLKFI